MYRSHARSGSLRCCNAIFGPGGNSHCHLAAWAAVELFPEKIPIMSNRNSKTGDSSTGLIMLCCFHAEVGKVSFLGGGGLHGLHHGGASYEMATLPDAYVGYPYLCDENNVFVGYMLIVSHLLIAWWYTSCHQCFFFLACCGWFGCWSQLLAVL